MVKELMKPSTAQTKRSFNDVLSEDHYEATSAAQTKDIKEDSLGIMMKNKDYPLQRLQYL